MKFATEANPVAPVASTSAYVSTFNREPNSMNTKPKLVSEASSPEEAASIAKPSGFSLDKFKSKRAAAMEGVLTLQTALPVHRIAEAKDFVRLHPDEEEYWSSELCFVNVPIKGVKRDTLHLIEEDLAMEYLPSARILRFRLALATKPYDVFFLCAVPTQNVDNTWVATNVAACLQGKDQWVMASSRKDEGVEAYRVTFAKSPDAFPAPKWPTQPLSELLHVTFSGRMIDHVDHPGLRRLVGDKQSAS
jgi:hypothetical protein